MTSGACCALLTRESSVLQRTSTTRQSLSCKCRDGAICPGLRRRFLTEDDCASFRYIPPFSLRSPCQNGKSHGWIWAFPGGQISRFRQAWLYTLRSCIQVLIAAKGTFLRGVFFLVIHTLKQGREHRGLRLRRGECDGKKYGALAEKKQNVVVLIVAGPVYATSHYCVPCAGRLTSLHCSVNTFLSES